jgi:hypothetical protein
MWIGYPLLEHNIISPALSSLTLGNQCFIREFVDDILGPSSQPWPQLQTITLCPKEDTFDAVRDALEDAVNSKRQPPARTADSRDQAFPGSRRLAGEWSGAGNFVLTSRARHKSCDA